MRLNKGIGVIAFVAVAASLASVARAGAFEPVVGRPASALIYPLFDSRLGHGTLISVTNTNTDRRLCHDSSFLYGDVCLHYTYFGFDATRTHCREFDVDECLTPGDTLTVIADQHNPNMEIGWLWVEARDPETNEAIDFNFLIGSAMVVDTDLGFLARYLPYGFRAWCTWGSDDCGHGFTDCNRNGRADFGHEYDAWPATLYLDNFFQEGGTNPAFDDVIALASCNTWGTTFVDTFFWNNRERRFSRDFDFVCHFLGRLSDIQVVAGNLNGDPDELRVGMRSLQTGWVQLTGVYSPILGVFIQRVANSNFGGGDVLEYEGIAPCSLERRG